MRASDDNDDWLGRRTDRSVTVSFIGTKLIKTKLLVKCASTPFFCIDMPVFVDSAFIPFISKQIRVRRA